MGTCNQLTIRQMQQKSTYILPIVLILIALCLFIMNNRDAVGVKISFYPDQFVKEPKGMVNTYKSFSVTQMTKNIEIISKKTQVVKYVIPSNEELDSSNNWTDLITIAHRYSDHIDVLCSQQIRVGSVFDGGKHVCIEDSIKPKINDCLVYSFGYSDHIDVLCSQQIRVGSVFDGGKHVCIEESLKPKFNDCLVYSFGSNNEFSFETDAIKLFGCEVHTFDPFKSGSRAPKGCQYHKIGLGTKDETKGGKKFQSLKSIMNSLKHSKRVIDILKIDIEGSEWKFLENVLNGNILTQQVKQITIEMHFPSRKGKNPQLNFILKLLRRLNESGFLTFSRERNTFCPGCTFQVRELNMKFSAVTEFSLLNDRFL